MDGTNSIGSAERGARRTYFGATLDVDTKGRRSWPGEIARRLAEESYTSGLPVEEFARKWGLGKTMISRWRMQLLRDRGGVAPTAPERKREETIFARAVVQDRHDPVAPHVAPDITIERGDIRVTISASTSADLVVAVIQAMRRTA